MRTNKIEIDNSFSGATNSFTGITTSINVNSTDQQSPSAKSVYNLMFNDSEVLSCITTNDSKTSLLTSASEKVIIPSATAYIITGKALGVTTDGKQSISSYTFTATVNNLGGVYKLLSNKVTEEVDESAIYGLGLEVDDTNHLNIYARGLNAITMLWKCKIDYVSVTV